MKKLTLLVMSVFVVSMLTSCGSSHARKGCRGNGSWDGNRNLGPKRSFGYIAPFPKVKEDAKTYYVQQQQEQHS